MKLYSENPQKNKVDWKIYEKEYANRVQYVGKELNNLAKAAIATIKINKVGFGRPQKLSLQQKVVTLILKSIFEKHNRPMAGLLSLFGVFSGMDVSYKTIERLYSDEIVQIALHNMFILTIKQKCNKIIDISGDGTGYTLTVTKHYRTHVDKEGYRKFVYFFNLIDIKTKLYVAWGSGIKSEKEAFENAIKMLRKVENATKIKVNSARLDRYYSYQSTLKYFDNETVLYIIPKSNTTINGPPKWRDIFRRMMKDPISYLIEYYKRESSESGWSVDKRMTGWKIWQKRDDRINTAINCMAILHNLFRIGYG
ncbi:MAG: ISNCY family transposase [Candidatus Marsarchaeota archaeon]|nr:ISNCY family transposase [Candidatus Marsarchaeota archaeon]